MYESEAMASLFKNKGYEVIFGREKADIYVINTCTVTGTGAQKSRQQIRRVKRENPDSILAVCGCLAQTEAEKLRLEMDIDVLLGNKYRNRIVDMVEDAINGRKSDYVENILKETSYEELCVTQSQSRVRANIKIQDGCNNFCSYCIIPFARGPVRSRSLDKIKEEALALGKSGYGEVVLTGIHIASYGKDLDNKVSLIDVIEAVHLVDGIKRIRLGSLEPIAITEDFVSRASKLEKLCPQFHLSLQSGCDETLKRMRRHYTTDEFLRAVNLLRSAIPDTSITTDLMVGFAGETDEEFKNSYEFCKKIGFSQMHIFPYSIRKGTAAENFPNQVSELVKTQRSHTMLKLAEEMKEVFYKKYIGKTLPVLLEQKKNNFLHGTTANYMDVLLNVDAGISGEIVNVLITDYQDENLIGEMV